MADREVLRQLGADLADEHDALDLIVGPLAARDWDRPTPAEGWSVRDQISHLSWFDERAVEAATDPERFKAGADAMMAGLPASMEIPVNLGRAMAPAGVLARWRDGRAKLLGTVVGLDPDARLPWYGPPMGAVSFVTARLMETWAHGQDVADALAARRTGTPRLRHVAHIGVGARPFSFRSRGLDVPSESVRVDLVGPSGEEWSWGDPEATDRVQGTALDFCLVVTQRRHVDDTGLAVCGPVATRWMTIAQAFAGPPGPGRQPGQFPPS